MKTVYSSEDYKIFPKNNYKEKSDIYIYIYIYIYITSPLLLWVEHSSIARETRVQSLVELTKGSKKWYLMPPCLTLSIKRYGSNIKRSNPGKGVMPSPTP